MLVKAIRKIGLSIFLLALLTGFFYGIAQLGPIAALSAFFLMIVLMLALPSVPAVRRLAGVDEQEGE